MNAIAFHPKVDIPLTAITVLALITNFVWWAKSDQEDTTVDLEARLPSAIAKVVVLFTTLLLICWFANLAVWAIYVCLILASCVGTILAANHVSGEVVIFLAAGIIREWCFGFPLLILQPPEEVDPTITDATSMLLDSKGTTVSVLRPTGRVQIDGDEFSAVSDDGNFIELGTHVVVTEVNGQQVRVRPADLHEDPNES